MVPVPEATVGPALFQRPGRAERATAASLSFRPVAMPGVRGLLRACHCTGPVGLLPTWPSRRHFGSGRGVPCVPVSVAGPGASLEGRSSGQVPGGPAGGIVVGVVL